MNLNLPKNCEYFYAPNMNAGEVIFNDSIERVLLGNETLNFNLPNSIKELLLPNIKYLFVLLPVGLKKLNLGNITNLNNPLILPELKSNLVSLTARKITNTINEDFFKEFNNLKELFLGDSIGKIEYLPSKLEYLEIHAKTKLPKRINKNIVIKRV